MEYNLSKSYGVKEMAHRNDEMHFCSVRSNPFERNHVN